MSSSRTAIRSWSPLSLMFRRARLARPGWSSRATIRPKGLDAEKKRDDAVPAPSSSKDSPGRVRMKSASSGASMENR